MYKKLILMSLATAALINIAVPSHSKDNTKESWIEKGHCHSFAPYQGPGVLLKSNLGIIGVDIGPNGEIIRMHPKENLLSSLPNNLSLSEHRNVFEKLSRADFFEKDNKEWPEWFQTPLDVGAKGDTTYIYVLLPEAWSYSASPISLKTSAKRWKHPHLKLPQTTLTDKAAVIHRSGQNYKNGQSCLYEFNLHVTVTQTDNGKTFSTDIIIDPGTNNGGDGLGVP